MNFHLELEKHIVVIFESLPRSIKERREGERGERERRERGERKERERREREIRFDFLMIFLDFFGDLFFANKKLHLHKY